MAARERPILFNASMVRAILEARKTQTRRVVKGMALDWLCPNGFTPEFVASPGNGLCPYGQPGDRLWVRETWGWDWYDDGQTRSWKRPVYRADSGSRPSDNGDPAPWKPSIHMPRRASRIDLEVTGVRVDRLQDISEADAEAEGVHSVQCNDLGTEVPYYRSLFDSRSLFKMLWESINGPGSWDANPWVWVVEFRRIRP